MELQDVLSKLGADEAAVITAAIEAEKNRGIAESRKKGEEVKKHLTKINGFKDAIKNTFGLDDLSDDADLKDVLQEKLKAMTSGKVDEGELAKLTREFNSLKKAFDATKEAETKAKEQARNLKITDQLKTQMQGKFHGSDLAIEKFIASGRVKMTEDEKVVFIQDGVEVDIAAGLEAFRKERPDLVCNTQSGGSGGSSTNTSNSSKVMSLGSFNQLGSKEKAAYMVLVNKGEAKLTDS